LLILGFVQVLEPLSATRAIFGKRKGEHSSAYPMTTIGAAHEQKIKDKSTEKHPCAYCSYKRYLNMLAKKHYAKTEYNQPNAKQPYAF
jgi:hypothetical protein